MSGPLSIQKARRQKFRAKSILFEENLCWSLASANSGIDRRNWHRFATDRCKVSNHDAHDQFLKLLEAKSRDDDREIKNDWRGPDDKLDRYDNNNCEIITSWRRSIDLLFFSHSQQEFAILSKGMQQKRRACSTIKIQRDEGY